jgi:uncharacterized FAD-dependent dehydrogenase
MPRILWRAFTFQEKWEKKAWELTGGKALPIQRYGDFYKDVLGKKKSWLKEGFNDNQDLESSCQGNTQIAPLNQCLPDYVQQRTR